MLEIEYVNYRYIRYISAKATCTLSLMLFIVYPVSYVVDFVCIPVILEPIPFIHSTLLASRCL